MSHTQGILAAQDVSKLTRESSIELFKQIGGLIRNGQIYLGRSYYALSLAHGVQQAIHCGYQKIVAIELGVASGAGLLDLCQAAHVFREVFKMDIQVYGLDGTFGLPAVEDYRDHPELWTKGLYTMPDPKQLRSKLPAFAELIIGDVGDTVKSLEEKIGDAKIGFVSIDLDYYSSTKRAMPLFAFKDPEKYLPAVPVYVDDIEQLITLNEWCGEAAAIKEFNAAHTYRKIDSKPYFNIPRFHVCHVLDHPIRQGKIKPPIPLSLYPF